MPYFLAYDNNNDEGKLIIKEEVEEITRIIKPPTSEEYSSEPYEFANIEEVNNFFKRANSETIDTLYEKARSIVAKYNIQDNHILNLLAADIIWSYFQDKFSTTHYLGVVGDNSSGKSTIGDTFEAIGYRVVNMTDPTSANIFRLLGTIEPGQCCIIADEAEKIDKSSDIMSVLKNGYQIKGKVARINTNTQRQEFFSAYCFKIIIAERSMNQSTAKGVLDRTFIIHCYKGCPNYDIKEVLNPQGNKVKRDLLNELLDFRKLMLIYRLLHYNDEIIDLDVNMTGRDKELSKPLIQLFHGTKIQAEISSSIRNFVDSKNQRRTNTIEYAVL